MPTVLDSFQFEEKVDWTRFYVDFEYRITVIPTKLGLSLFTYGDRGNTLERMSETSLRSSDGSAILTSESEHDITNETHGIEKSSHCVRVNLHRVNPKVTAMLICLNGGPRSFNNITGTLSLSIYQSSYPVRSSQMTSHPLGILDGMFF